MESVRVHYVDRNLPHFSICDVTQTVTMPKTPAQDNSNTVLFQMMMHYKEEKEAAEKEAERCQAKTDKLIKIHNERLTRMMQLEAEAEEEEAVNRTLRTMMRRANAIEHHRAHFCDQLIANVDDLFDAIDLVHETQLGGMQNLGVDYISMHCNAVRQRCRTAAENYTQRVAIWNVSDEDLAADEVIDLTGEETEEEEEDRAEDFPWRNPRLHEYVLQGEGNIPASEFWRNLTQEERE